jgi:hypothetical protein
VYGAPTQVVIETASDRPAEGRRSEDKPSPLRDDPVVSAFRKHLGGEIVDSRKR